MRETIKDCIDDSNGRIHYSLFYLAKTLMNKVDSGKIS